MEYDKYLQTEHWRRLRDNKLRQVHFRCERCGTKTNLEVHHQHYHSLGHEQLADLEALCRDCHEKHHIDNEQERLGIYFKIIEDVVGKKLRENVRFDCLADLSGDIKDRLLLLKIPYDEDKITRAMSLMGDGRLGIRPVQVAKSKRFHREHEPPSEYWLTQAETIAVLRQLGITDLRIKTMPPEPAARIVDRDRTDYDADDPRIYRE